MIDNLKLAISQKDIGKAREILKDELLEKNYPNETFKEALDLASNYEIFDAHDNEVLSDNPDEWTLEYFNKLKFDLESNFSKERFVKAYYVSRKIKNLIVEDESESSTDVKKKFKNLLVVLETTAAVVGTVTIGAGIYFLTKKLRK